MQEVLIIFNVLRKFLATSMSEIKNIYWEFLYNINSLNEYTSLTVILLLDIYQYVRIINNAELFYATLAITFKLIYIYIYIYYT